MIDGKRLMVHAAAILLLIFLFGSGVYSLSIDVAHHFAVINFLTVSDVASLKSSPAMEHMSQYPRVSHWLAAGLGMIIGSPYAAMWLICLVSVYVCYCSLSNLVAINRGLISVIIFNAIILSLVGTGILPGHEIIGNFFYSQLLGVAIYYCILVAIARRGGQRDISLVVIALVAASLLFGIHLLPALNIIGTIGLMLVINAVFGFLSGTPIRRNLIAILVLSGAGIVLMVMHPAFADMRMLASNDGSLEFPLSPRLMFASLIVVAVISAWQILRSGEARRSQVDVLIVSAMLASLVLMIAQLLALVIMGEGSAYAVKKHFFIVVPLTAVCAARVLSSLWPEAKIRCLGGSLASIGAALFATWMVYPGKEIMPQRQVTRPLNYAENAILNGLPEFRDGNTAIVADSVDPITRYMINLSVFHVPFQRSIDLIKGKNNLNDYVYLMYDAKDPSSSHCEDRYFDSNKYVFVRSSCVSKFQLGYAYPHTGVSGVVDFVGWSIPEAAHRWSDGSSSVLKLLLPTTSDEQLCLSLAGFTLGAQAITVTVNGQSASEHRLDGEGLLTAPLGSAKGETNVELAFSDPRRPGTEDPRILAFAVRTVTVKPCEVRPGG